MSMKNWIFTCLYLLFLNTILMKLNLINVNFFNQYRLCLLNSITATKCTTQNPYILIHAIALQFTFHIRLHLFYYFSWCNWESSIIVIKLLIYRHLTVYLYRININNKVMHIELYIQGKGNWNNNNNQTYKYKYSI